MATQARVSERLAPSGGDGADELLHLAATCAENEFLEAFLQRLTARSGALAGAVWIAEGGQLRRTHAVDWDRVGLDGDEERSRAHLGLVERAVKTGQCFVCGPRAADADDPAGNPTNYRLLIAPLRSDQRAWGAVELFKPHESTDEGEMQRLVAWCKIVVQYMVLCNSTIHTSRNAYWARLLELSRGLATAPTVRDLSMFVANEGRRLLKADRVSLLTARRERMSVAAVSGLDVVESRTESAKKLCALAEAVAKTGRPLVYLGLSSEIAPQLAGAIQGQLDASPMRTVAVIPLYPAPPPEPEPITGQGALGSLLVKSAEPDSAVVGALVVEHQTDWPLGKEMLEREASHLGTMVGPALDKLQQHESVFLLPLWRWLGGLRHRLFHSWRRLTAAIALAILAFALALAVIPWDFEIEGQGTLLPVVRRDLFSESDGQVVEVHVAHGDRVAKDQLLVVMRNLDLEVKLAGLVGERNATAERLAAVETSLLRKEELSSAERSRLHGERVVLGETLAGIDRQLVLYAEKRKQLEIRSPIDGEVITWDVADQLKNRPVRRGERLLSVVDPSGPWKLEVRLPEQGMRQVSEAFDAQGGKLDVRYVPKHASHLQLRGTGASLHGRAEVRGEEGNTVLLHVDIRPDEIPDLRTGATVTARVNCGKRSLGYVIGYDLLAAARRHILFRWFW